jgi:putative restriction endonuclease
LGIVEAAHIVPVSEPDSEDSVWNGIALCPNHHRLYDRNLLVLTEDLQVAVDGERLDLLADAGLGEGHVALRALDGQTIAEPKSWGDQAFRDSMRKALVRRVGLVMGKSA